MHGGRQGAARRRWELWPWLALLPFGFGSWAPVIAGRRYRKASYVAVGLGWLAVTIGGVVVSGRQHGHGTAGGALLLLSWVGGAISAFVIRHRSASLVAAAASRERLDWPTPTARSRTWTARYALAAYIATFAYAGVLGLVLVRVLGIHIRLGVGGLLVDAGLVASLVPLARRGALSREDLGLRPTLGARSVWLVALGLVAYFVIAGLWVLAFARHEPAAKLLGSAHPDAINETLDIVALAVSAPVVEEIFFRGLLYRSLRNRLPILPAAVIAGCLFGLVHILGYPLITLPIKAAFGVIACLLYERTGSLLPGIALHSFVDASAADLAFTGNDDIVLICSAALVLLVLVATRVQRLMRGDRSRIAGPGSDHPLPAVADARQEEPVRWSGGTGGGAGGAAEERGELIE